MINLTTPFIGGFEVSILTKQEKYKMETNNKIEALRLYLDETINITIHTIEQAEDDDCLFNVELISATATAINKKYLVLTECEAEDRQDQNLDNYIEEYLDNIPLDVKKGVGLLIDYFDFDYWKNDMKINETAAMSFNSVHEGEYCSTYDDVEYYIYEIEI